MTTQQSRPEKESSPPPHHITQATSPGLTRVVGCVADNGAAPASTEPLGRPLRFLYLSTILKHCPPAAFSPSSLEQRMEVVALVSCRVLGGAPKRKKDREGGEVGERTFRFPQTAGEKKSERERINEQINCHRDDGWDIQRGPRGGNTQKNAQNSSRKYTRYTHQRESRARGPPLRSDLRAADRGCPGPGELS